MRRDGEDSINSGLTCRHDECKDINLVVIGSTSPKVYAGQALRKSRRTSLVTVWSDFGLMPRGRTSVAD